ncbi:MAG TPA: cytochrome c [Bryobacteraceae bacterium]|jgi:mono/diheme cytochrome c family protein
MKIRVLLALVLVPVVSMIGQTTSSVWDGIYTGDQAGRGEAGYAQACASCHGRQLQGGAQNPPLAGADFVANWNGQTVGDLFEKIQTTMPADRPGKLTPVQNAEIVAYILQFNKFPSGSKELPGSIDALKSVRFEEKKSGSKL